MLPNNLKKWREDKGMTPTELAELTGVSQASISRIENGEQQPRPNLLNKIAMIFNESPSDFYSDRASKIVGPAPGPVVTEVNFLQTQNPRRRRRGFYVDSVAGSTQERRVPLVVVFISCTFIEGSAIYIKHRREPMPETTSGWWS